MSYKDYDEEMYDKLMKYSRNHPENAILWINPDLSVEEKEKLEISMFGKKLNELSYKEKMAYQRATSDLEYNHEVYQQRDNF